MQAMNALMQTMVRLLMALLIAATAGTALGQQQGSGDRRPEWGGGGGRMSELERQRFREDLQRQYPDPRRGAADPGGEERARRYAEWQRLSPEQREGIRRDMRDYNRDFDRRR